MARSEITEACRLWALSICGSLLLPVSAPSLAQDRSHKVDLGLLLRETQQQSVTPSRTTVAWWIPEEYWKVGLEQARDVPPEGRALLNALRSYLLLGVVDGTFRPQGGLEFQQPERLRQTVTVVDERGRRHRSIPLEQAAPEVVAFLSMMKPMVAEGLGSLGQNLAFLLFPAVDKDGVPIGTAKEDGGFSVEVGDVSFRWQTPLPSLLPPKLCPIDRQEMTGAWVYCPWHGAKLIALE